MSVEGEWLSARKRVLSEEDSPMPKKKRPRTSGGKKKKRIVLSSDSEEDESDVVEVAPIDEDEEVKEVLESCEAISETIIRHVRQLKEGDDSALKEGTGEGLIQDASFFANGLSLKKHQLFALNWMRCCRAAKCNCILADEMGLGKTVEAISLLAYLHAVEDNDGPHLVVAPASVLANWEREFKRWYPALNVVRYHGSAKERKELQDDVLSGELPCDVILTTFSFFEKDSEASRSDRSFLRMFHFEYLVVDEAHALRNIRSAKSRRLLTIKADHKLLLTGTPVQNSLPELLSLLTFVMPNVFAGDPSQALFNRSDEYEEDANKNYIAHVQKTLAPFILRRLKHEILDLPTKTTVVERLQFDGKERALYDKLVADWKENRAERAAAGGASIFVALRKACNHPLLLRTRYVGDDVARVCRTLHDIDFYGPHATLKQVEAEVHSLSDFDIGSIVASVPALADLRLPDDALLQACKVRFLRERLPILRDGGSRVLLFSQWTSVLDILEGVLRGLGMLYLRLDGTTPVAERQVLIDEFEKDPGIAVFLLSTKAGGLGLNLTAANVCIFYDVDFNVQNDNQGEDRCHRIGQTRPVTVYKLVAKDTVDERVLQVAARKSELEGSVLGKRREGGDASPTEKKAPSTMEAIRGILEDLIGEA